MKKISIIIVILALFYITPQTIHAATAAKTSPTPGPSTQEEQQNLSNQIDQLKERIASKVAELNLVDKRGILGTVSDASNNQITLTDIQGNIRFIDVDELTVFSSPSAKTDFGISDIVKGTTLGAYGLYNKESKRLLARFIDVLTLPSYTSGEISAVDRANYTLTVAGENNKQTVVDIEDFTKTTTYSGSDDTAAVSGFSKLDTGNRVIIVGYPNKTIKNRVTATRIMVFPDLLKDPKITIPQAAISGTGDITPSTGSGKKLTPITK